MSEWETHKGWESLWGANRGHRAKCESKWGVRESSLQAAIKKWLGPKITPFHISVVKIRVGMVERQRIPSYKLGNSYKITLYKTQDHNWVVRNWNSAWLHPLVPPSLPLFNFYLPFKCWKEPFLLSDCAFHWPHPLKAVRGGGMSQEN